MSSEMTLSDWAQVFERAAREAVAMHDEAIRVRGKRDELLALQSSAALLTCLKCACQDMEKERRDQV